MLHLCWWYLFYSSNCRTISAFLSLLICDPHIVQHTQYTCIYIYAYTKAGERERERDCLYWLTFRLQFIAWIGCFGEGVCSARMLCLPKNANISVIYWNRLPSTYQLHHVAVVNKEKCVAIRQMVLWTESAAFIANTNATYCCTKLFIIIVRYHLQVCFRVRCALCVMRVWFVFHIEEVNFAHFQTVVHKCKAHGTYYNVVAAVLVVSAAFQLRQKNENSINEMLFDTLSKCFHLWQVFALVICP